MTELTDAELDRMEATVKCARDEQWAYMFDISPTDILALIAALREAREGRDDLSQAFGDAKLDLEARTIQRDTALAERDEARRIASAWHEILTETEARAEQAEAENKRLRAALEPFAALAEEIIELCAGTMHKDPNCWVKACSWSDLRAARAALKENEHGK